MIFLLKLIVASLMLFGFVRAAMAGSVTGQVMDEKGLPFAGVQVEVVYQSYSADQLNNAGASIKAEAVTDGNGRYRIETDSLPPGEYAAHAYQVVENSGQQSNVDLAAENNSTFAGNADTVRNFSAGTIESSADMPYGNAGILVLNNAIADYTDLAAAQVTLENVTDGTTYVKSVRPSGEGLVVTGIPLGTYRASVTLDGKLLQIALWGPGQSDRFGDSVTHDFTMGYAGNQLQLAVKP